MENKLTNTFLSENLHEDKISEKEELKITKKNSFRRKVLHYESQIKDNNKHLKVNGNRALPKFKFRNEIQISINDSKRKPIMRSSNETIKRQICVDDSKREQINKDNIEMKTNKIQIRINESERELVNRDKNEIKEIQIKVNNSISEPINKDNKETNEFQLSGNDLVRKPIMKGNEETMHCQVQQVGQGIEEKLESKYIKKGRDRLPRQGFGTDTCSSLMTENKTSISLTSAAISAISEISSTRSAFLNQLIDTQDVVLPRSNNLQVIAQSHLTGRGITLVDPSPIETACMQAQTGDKKRIRKKPQIPGILFKAAENTCENEAVFSIRELTNSNENDVNEEYDGKCMSIQSNCKVDINKPYCVQRCSDDISGNCNLFKMTDGDLASALIDPNGIRFCEKSPIVRAYSTPSSCDNYENNSVISNPLDYKGFNSRITENANENNHPSGTVERPTTRDSLSTYTSTITTSQTKFCIAPFYYSLQNLNWITNEKELLLVKQHSKSEGCIVCKQNSTFVSTITSNETRKESVKEKQCVKALNIRAPESNIDDTNIQCDAKKLLSKKKNTKKISIPMVTLRNAKEIESKRKHRLFRNFSSDSSVYSEAIKSYSSKLSPKEKLINFKYRSRNFIKERLKAERKCFSAEPDFQFCYEEKTNEDKCTTLPANMKSNRETSRSISQSPAPAPMHLRRQFSRDDSRYEYIDSTDEFSVSDTSFTSKEKKTAVRKESSIQEEDSSAQRKKDEENILYFRDTHIDSAAIKKERIRNFEKRAGAMRSIVARSIISQTSSDSDGPEDFAATQKRLLGDTSSTIYNPQETVSSYQEFLSLNDYSNNYGNSSSRNASPSPYMCDSDSGERYSPRSPFGARRYSKRPLRGPYGEMLEAEMSKSKSASQFLNEDMLFMPKEYQSLLGSETPNTPTTVFSSPNFLQSPIILVPDENTPSYSTSRSLDDSSLRIYYSSLKDPSTESDLNPSSSPPESVNSSLLQFPSSPFHHRTASSPSKLYYEPEIEHTPGLFVQSSSNKLPEVRASKTLPHTNLTKAKSDRKVKHTKLAKCEDEGNRSTALLKKSALEKEFRSHTEPRHIHRRHRVSTSFESF